MTTPTGAPGRALAAGSSWWGDRGVTTEVLTVDELSRMAADLRTTVGRFTY